MAKRTAPKSSPIPATPAAPRIKSATATAIADAAKPVSTTRSNGSARLQSITLEPTVLTHDEIARRAYVLWQQTGNPDALHNWSEAERQLRVELGVG